MTCGDIEKYIPDYLEGSLEPELLQTFERHLQSCENCRKEIAELRNVWEKVANLPEEQPSPALRKRFYESLDAYTSGLESAGPRIRVLRIINDRLERILPRKPLMQIAAALLLFAAGLLAGSRSDIFSGSYSAELTEMRSEMSQLNKLLVFTLLDQSSPSKRLQAIDMISNMEYADEDIVEALVNIASDDPNVNVRVASVEALQETNDLKSISTQMFAALIKQTSPLVQLSIIEFLVSIREDRAINLFKEMLTRKDLDQTVRNRLELAIAQLNATQA